MPYKIAGQPGTWYSPGERKGNSTIVWRGQLPNGKWTELVTDATRQSGAQSYLSASLKRWHRDTPPAAGKVDVDLGTAAHHYKQAELRSDIERDRVDSVVGFLGAETPIGEVNQSHVTLAAKAFRAQRARDNARAAKERRQTFPPPSAATINREVVTPLRGIVNFASSQRWCTKIVLNAVKPEEGELPRLPRPAASDAGVGKLLEAIADKLATLKPTGRGRDLNYHRQRRSLEALRALVIVVHERGYRISEWLRWDWKTIDLPAARAHMLVSKPDRWVEFELGAEAVAALATLEPKDAGKVFPWIHRSAVYEAVDKIAPEGVSWRPHESRRAVVTTILKNTGDVALARDFVAHASIKTTFRYRVVDPAEVAPAVRRARGRRGRK